ncbi:hypothetical protein Hanom_Chr06g00514561 [Helianthus anomalus]
MHRRLTWDFEEETVLKDTQIRMQGPLYLKDQLRESSRRCLRQRHANEEGICI